MLLKQGSKGPKVKRVQVRLAELGHFTGTPRGNFGPRTAAAVGAFQRATKGLTVDEKVGANTWQALFGKKISQGKQQPTRKKELPPWLNLAMLDLYRGMKEIPGAEHNPYVVEAHAATSLKAKTDEVPWCSSIMCLWMEKSGVRSTRSAAAASWRTWGRELPYGEIGCVVVMKRTGGNHVGIYLGEDNYGVYFLGGNQNNKVCVRRYGWDFVTNFRWPTEAEGWKEAA